MKNCIQCTEIGAETAMNGNRYVCDKCRGVENKDDHTTQAYYNEFVVIDGLSQHKDNLSYYEWLEKKVN